MAYLQKWRLDGALQGKKSDQFCQEWLFKLQQFEKAVDDLTAAALSMPKQPDIYFARGVALSRLNRLDDALADFSKALHLVPNNSAAYYARGEVHRGMNHHQRAIDDYGKAIQLNPALKEAYYWRAASDWVEANNRMAKVLKAKGYHYQYLFCRNAGHGIGNAKAQFLPHAIEWVWKGYAAKKSG